MKAKMRSWKHLLNKPVHVEWIDASGMTTIWGPSKELIRQLNMVNVETVGFLIGEDPDAVYISTSHDVDQNLYAGIEAIPKGCVKKVKRL